MPYLGQPEESHQAMRWMLELSNRYDVGDWLKTALETNKQASLDCKFAIEHK